MNPKKIWIGIGVCLVALSTLAATIVWYNDASIPQKTVFDGSEVLAVEKIRRRVVWRLHVVPLGAVFEHGPSSVSASSKDD